MAEKENELDKTKEEKGDLNKKLKEVMEQKPVVPEVDNRLEKLVNLNLNYVNPFENLHMTPAILNAMKAIENPVPLIDAGVSDAIQRFLEQQEQFGKSVQKAVEQNSFDSLQHVTNSIRSAIQGVSHFFSQPPYVDALKSIQQSLKVFKEITDEDDRMKKYDTPHFWRNVSKASEELIILPLGVTDEVLDTLNLASCDMEVVKQMLEEFNVSELKEELEDDEHLDYLFKGYLQEILELHQSRPTNYRVSIPALFSLVEGTLGEIFKISEDGMASEIKKKMNVFSDIYSYVYTNQFMGSAFTFRNNLFLANIKSTFHQLTVNSKDAGVQINRNAVLHGKANPSDWTMDEFVTLLHLLHTTLFLRKTVDILTSEFHDMIHNEFYDEQPLMLTEFEKSIRLTDKNGNAKKFNPGDINAYRKELKTDLNHIFNYDDSTFDLILKKSNFHEIENRLLSNK